MRDSVFFIIGGYMKKGFFASEKYIIGIREYMEVFLKTTYSWRGKLTHKKLNEFLTDKGYALPKRSHFDELGRCINW